jgi:hypothetical protein
MQRRNAARTKKYDITSIYRKAAWSQGGAYNGRCPTQMLLDPMFFDTRRPIRIYIPEPRPGNSFYDGQQRAFPETGTAKRLWTLVAWLFVVNKLASHRCE